MAIDFGGDVRLNNALLLTDLANVLLLSLVVKYIFL